MSSSRELRAVGPYSQFGPARRTYVGPSSVVAGRRGRRAFLFFVASVAFVFVLT